MLLRFERVTLNSCRLHVEVLKAGIEIRRASYTDIRDAFKVFPLARAFINCTGLGSYYLKGVEDDDLYPTLVNMLAFFFFEF